MKKRVTVFSENKSAGIPTTVITAYDYATACILERSDIDSILIGDSLGMVFQGNPDPLSVTVDEIIYHTKAVKKGAPSPFLIADMPFLSYHVSVEDTVRNAGKIIKESGAEAVKIEGGHEIEDMVRALVKAKIPVIGHLGLTPQSVNVFGGFKVQGKTETAARQLLDDSLLLQSLGVSALVLECVPEKLATLITERLDISTIGIGSGLNTDGQVLVINDILGLYETVTPKFVKKYGNVGLNIKESIDVYISEVRSKQFPDRSHTFSIDDGIIEKIKNR